MAKGYRPVDRDQGFLLPPDLRDWLPPNHRVWFVLDVVDTLDLSAFHATSKRGGVGRAGYNPQVLLGVMFYAYMHGLLSSRGIEKACGEDIAYMVACGRDVPDHTVIARFRQCHESAITDLFAQVLELCVRAGLGRFEVVAIDGTKIAANASKKRNQRLSKLQEQAGDVLARAAAADAAEDARHGAGDTGLDLDRRWQDPGTRKSLIADALSAINDADADADGDGGGVGSDQDPASRTRTPGQADPTDPAAAPPTSTGLAVTQGSSEIVLSAQELARRERFQHDADTRFLAAMASIRAQDQIRDDVFRQRRLIHANNWLQRARTKVERIRAEQQHKETARREAYDTRAARVRWSRPFRDHPVEECSAMRRAKLGLAKAEQNMADVLAAPRPPSLRADRVGNLTDPDSRLMRTTGAYIQGYNAQLACTNDHLILAVAITQSGNDHSSGIPMMNAAVAAVATLSTTLSNPDLQIGTVLMDAGYCSTDTINAPGPNRLIATGRQLREAADNAGPTTRSPEELNDLGKMAKRLVEPGNAELYKRRGATIEAINGHIKDRRGLRTFSRRGLTAVTSELNLSAMTTNLAKLHRHLSQPAT